MFAAAAIARERVFVAAIMPGGAYVAAAVARFVSMEVVERLFSAPGEWAMIAVMWVVAVIDVAIETVRAMEPGASSDEHPASKPIRPIVAIRSAVIGGIVKVPIRAYRRWSDVNGDLSRCHGHAAHQCNSESKEGKRLPSGHIFLL